LSRQCDEDKESEERKRRNLLITIASIGHT
jgi:hypothetical protein